jgi:hypothetical protein
MDRTLIKPQSRIKHLALVAFLLTGALLLNMTIASVEDNAPPGTTATRPAKTLPAKTLPEQTSIEQRPAGIGHADDRRSQPGRHHQDE